MINNMSDIGGRIRKKREELGYKQQGFATKIKIDKSSLNRYEKGTQTPSVETLVAIADGLETSLDYLVYGAGDETVKRKKPDEETYLRKSLKAMVTLIENGFMVVVNNKSIEGIAINLKRVPTVLEFFDEAANFGKCKGRMDDVSYEKGIDKIISEYEWRITNDLYQLNPMGYPDYSRMQENDERYEEAMQELKDKYGKKD